MGKTERRVVAAAVRRAYVMELRVRGNGYRNIARMTRDHFGAENLPKHWDERYAYSDVMNELTRLRKETAERAEVVRDLELARLDRLFNTHFDRAVRGDKTAVDRCLRIMDRRAKYLGLDKPVKVAPTDPTGEKEFATDARDRLAQLLSGIAERQSEMGDTLSAE